MKKTIFVIIAAVMATVIAMAATGCGKSSEESSQASTIPKATNATTAPTESTSYGRYNSNATTATRPTNLSTSSTEATEATEETESETQAAESSYLGDIAMSYFSVSSDVGATAELSGTETAPNGVTFYLYTVYYSGNTYPLYVSEDGSQLLEPEYFQSYAGSVSGGGSSDSNNTAEEYNQVETYAAQ